MKKNLKYRVGVIGCGMILNRHLESIDANSSRFELVALCDIRGEKVKPVAEERNVPAFTDYLKMLKKMKAEMDLVSIATPNALHYAMAVDALRSGYNILIEKPIDFERQRIHRIGILADELGLSAWAVLQVRYNPTVSMVKRALDMNLLGTIRVVSFVQRWQRPYSYFEGWRGETTVGGGVLYEVAIHYLDIVQQLFGVPRIRATSVYSHKHKHVKVEDTVLALAEYPNGPSGTIEVTIASEPSNIECSLSILGSEGFLEIGGKALDEVKIAMFEKKQSQMKWDALVRASKPAVTPNSYGTHVGSCPNHPTLYKAIAEGNGIPVVEAAPSIEFIQRIYDADGIAYHNGYEEEKVWTL